MKRTRSMRAAAGLLLIASGALAQTPTDLDEVHFSGDIDNALPGDMAMLVSNDDTTIAFDPDTGIADGSNFLGDLGNSDVDGYHNADACGARLFSLDATTEINGTVMRPADVFTQDGTKFFDAQGEAFPDGVNIDAISRDPVSCDLVFSVDVTASIGGLTFRPDDLIAWNSGAGINLYLSRGFGVNIDALHILADGRFLYSIDAAGDIAGTGFEDQDVIESIPGGPGTFEVLSFSPSAFDDSWGPADVDALWGMSAAEAGQFHWQTDSVVVLESDGTVNLIIERINGTEGPVTVSWSTVDDTATSALDFVGASGGASFADGEVTKGVAITLLNDGLTEGSEQFFVDLTGISSGAGTLTSPTRVTVIIRDDEDFIFQDGFEN